MVFSEEKDLKGGGIAMGSELSPNFDTRYPDSIGNGALSIALIGPDDGRRKAMSNALAECRWSQGPRVFLLSHLA